MACSAKNESKESDAQRIFQGTLQPVAGADGLAGREGLAGRDDGGAGGRALAAGQLHAVAPDADPVHRDRGAGPDGAHRFYR